MVLTWLPQIYKLKSPTFYIDVVAGDGLYS